MGLNLENPEKNYMLDYRFPSGDVLDENWEIDTDFISDRDRISDRESLEWFLNRWKYLFPSLREIDAKNIDIPDFIRFRDDRTYQDSHAEEKPKFCTLLMPWELFDYFLLARKWQVPISIVMGQMFRAGRVRIEKEFWYLRSREELLYIRFTEMMYG